MPSVFEGIRNPLSQLRREEVWRGYRGMIDNARAACATSRIPTEM